MLPILRPAQQLLTPGYFSPRLWLDASDPSNNKSVFADGAAVAAWVDKSGNGYSAVQSTVGLRPIYKTGIIGGLPIIRFDGATQYMTSPAGLLAQLTNQVTIFIVSASANMVGNSILQSVVDVNTNRINIHLPWSDNKVYWDFGNISGSGRLDGAWGGSLNTFYLWGFAAGSSAMSVRRNGTTIISKTASSSVSFTTQTLDVGTGTAFFGGDIAEIIIYNQLLSTTVRQTIERYLIKKWGIT